MSSVSHNQPQSGERGWGYFLGLVSWDRRRRYLETPLLAAGGMVSCLQAWWGRVRGFDRQWTLGCLGAVGLSAGQPQHGRQSHGPQPVGPLWPSLTVAREAGHGSEESLPRKLTHSFMLKTWLASVSRSIRAAVR